MIDTLEAAMMENARLRAALRNVRQVLMDEDWIPEPDDIESLLILIDEGLGEAGEVDDG